MPIKQRSTALNHYGCQFGPKEVAGKVEGGQIFEGGGSLQGADAKRETVEGVDKITVRAGMTLFGAWLVQLIIGAQLAMGNMTVYFVSFYRMSMGDKSVHSGTFYPMQPIIVVIATLIYPLGNKMIDWFGKESRQVRSICWSDIVTA